jgi:hypothetical protein
MTGPRIGLIHATPLAIEPVRAALAAHWPEAAAVNILDDSLSADRATATGLDDRLTDRILSLARYARSIDCEGILFTCSAFGNAIERAASELDVPVLKPNEAMFEAAIRHGGRIAMLYTFAPAAAGMEAEFHDQVNATGTRVEFVAIPVVGAIDALRGGDFETHNRLVAGAAEGLTDCSAIMLAHFSTSVALDAVRAKTTTPVLTSPEAAVHKLREHWRACE